jgi:transcriptional regulator with XRE-family HTH domain
MEIYERIAYFRKLNKMSQADFGRKLGLKQGIISSWELGNTKIADANIKLICLIYRVNEHWLRTGEGDILQDPISIEEWENEFILKLRRLHPDTQKWIVDYVDMMLEREQSLRGDPPETVQEAPKQATETPQEAEIEESIA